MLTDRARRLVSLLAALTALVLAGCAGVTTTPGPHRVGAQNGVWALNLTTPTAARPIASDSSCVRPGFTASTTGMASGFCVAAEEASRPVALGLKDYLDQFAADQGAVTWKSLPESQLPGDGWKLGVSRVLEDPNQRVLFNLEGVDAWAGATRAAAGRGGATDWELLQVRNNDYPNLEFWNGGQQVPHPFR